MARVLVIRLSSIGDIILTAPVVKALVTADTGSTVDFLVHERYSPLVNHFDPPPHNILAFPPELGAAGIPGYARGLGRAGYDLVIDLHDSLRSKLLRRFFHRSELRIYRKPRLKRWLLFYAWHNRFPAGYSVVGEYLRYAGLSLPDDEQRPRMRVAPGASLESSRKWGLGDDYVACVPGAAWPQKSWFPQRYVELFHREERGGQAPLVLLGGPGDTICDEIADGLPGKRVVNLKGKTSLEQALAVLAGSRLVIGADTGLLHAGEALGVPVVMILGPTSQESGARTHHPESRLLEVALWCRPCSLNGKRPCYRRQQFCLSGITVDQVAESVQQIMASA